MKLKELRGIFVLLLIVVFGGAGAYSILEGWSYLDAVYFAVVTITTLGYGDLVPLTISGKIFTIFFSLSGIAIGLYILSVLGKYMAMELHKKGYEKIIKLKKGESFDISKLSIDQKVEWHPDKKDVFEGFVNMLTRNEARIKLNKKNGKLMSKKDHQVIVLDSKGKLKR